LKQNKDCQYKYKDGSQQNHMKNSGCYQDKVDISTIAANYFPAKSTKPEPIFQMNTSPPLQSFQIPGLTVGVEMQDEALNFDLIIAEGKMNLQPPLA